MSSDVFLGLSDDPLKIKRLMEKTKIFDLAITGSAEFFDFLCDMTNGEERPALLRAYFDKERFPGKKH